MEREGEISRLLRQLETAIDHVHRAIFNSPASSFTSAAQRQVLGIELRRLGGTIHSLWMLALAIDTRGEKKGAGDLSYVYACDQFLKSLLRRDASQATLVSLSALASNDGQPDPVLSLARFKTQFDFALLAADGDALIQCLSMTEPPLPSSSQTTIAKTKPETAVTAATVRSWLRLLTRDEFGREPAEFAVERTHVRRRTVETPEYSIAARRWPDYAETFWHLLKPDIMAAFEPHLLRFNTVQWLLEYYRERWPLFFGYEALSGRMLVLLTDQLCRLEPLLLLRIAACLGLPSLCRELAGELAGRLDRDQFASETTSALLMALLGPCSLLLGLEVDFWTLFGTEISESEAQARIATIGVLLEVGGTFPATFEHNGQRWPMAEVALSICVMMRSASVFFNIIHNGARIDLAFQKPDRLTQLVHRSCRKKDSATTADTADTADTQAKTGIETEIDIQTERTVSEIVIWLLDLALREIENPLLNDCLFDDLSRLVLEMGFQLTVSDEEEHRRVRDVADHEYLRLVRVTVTMCNRIALRRLMMDPRWDANAPYLDEDGDGGTILHIAVEQPDMTAEVMEELFSSSSSSSSSNVRSGPNVEARDNSGRTPFLLAETAHALRVLIGRGCDTTACDLKSRNAWHVAANNNDVEVLKCLAAIDPNRGQNLRRTDGDGNTPLAAAIVRSHKQATAVLLKLCAGEGGGVDRALLYRSSKSLLHEVVRVGSDKMIITRLLEAGVDANAVDDQGRSVLHVLVLVAPESLVRVLQEACRSAPLLSKDGLTAPESVFMVGAKEGRSSWMSLPAFGACGSAFRRLLTPQVLASRDGRGRGLWERFCASVVSMMFSSPRRRYAHLEMSLPSAIMCLVDTGAMLAYETDTHLCGAGLLLQHMTNSGRDELPVLPCDVFSPMLENSQFVDSFVRTEAGTRLMRSAMMLSMDKLVSTLLRLGVSVFDRIDGRSVMEAALLAPVWSTCSMECVAQTETGFRDKINALRTRQGNNLLHSMLQSEVTDVACRIRFLVNHGMDPDTRVLSDTLWRGAPALVAYMLRSQAQCVAVLLACGADPLAAAEGGVNLLHAIAAVSSGQMMDHVRALARIRQLEESGDLDWAARCDFVFVKKKTSVPDAPTTAARLGFQAADQIRLHGVNALHLASFHANVDMVQYCLGQLGIDVNAEAEGKRLPIHYAAMCGSAECLRVLVDHGANLDGRTSPRGLTPLHEAVVSAQPRAVKALLSMGADPKLVDEAGLLPLHQALAMGHQEMVAILMPTKMPAQTPATALDRVQRARLLGTAFQRVILGGQVEGFRILLDLVLPGELDMIMADCGECRPLLLAAVGAHVFRGSASTSASTGSGKRLIARSAAMVVQLLRAGARGFTGCCPVHFSGTGGWDVLAEACKIPRSARKGGNEEFDDLTPLLDAYLAQRKQWLAAAAFSPVHIAARHGLGHTLRLLIAHLDRNAVPYLRTMWLGKQAPDPSVVGPLTRARHADFMTRALSQRVTAGSQESQELRGESLVKRGDEQGNSCVFGSTPLHLACMRHHEDFKNPTMHAAKKSSINVNSPRDAQGDNGQNRAIFTTLDPALVEMLVGAGADVNAADEELNTPLHVAAESGNLGAVALLVTGGADLNRQNVKLYTPLLAAVAGGHVDVTRMLVEAGARTKEAWSTEGRLKKGVGLLGVCASLSKSPATFEYLWHEVGLEATAADSDGRTPVHDMMLNAEFTGYVMNSDVDFFALTDIDNGGGGGEFFSKLVNIVVNQNVSQTTATSILRRLLRRLPRTRALAMIDACPDNSVGALSRCVQANQLPALRLLLDFGADPDARGSKTKAGHGSALMMACARGRVEAAKLLVSKGASLVLEDGGDGKGGGDTVRSAVACAESYPDLVQWLLVRRFTEARLLGPGSGGSGVDGQDVGPRRWRGPWKGEYVASSTAGCCGWTRHGARFDFLCRMSRARRSLAGEVWPVTLVRGPVEGGGGLAGTDKVTRDWEIDEKPGRGGYVC